MEEFKELSSLLDYLNGVENTICIDGFCGSGKSCLASALSIRPSRCVVRIDNFARERCGESKFSDLVDLEKLNRAIDCVPRGSIVEGVLVRQLLAKKHFDAMTTIYVKRISGSSGIWHDAPDLQSPSDHWLHGEILDYHANFEPHMRADIVYLRVER